jgi:hypothetical protein
MEYDSYSDYLEKYPNGSSCKMEYHDKNNFHYMFIQNTSTKATVYFQRMNVDDQFTGVCLLEVDDKTVRIRDLFYEYINEEQEEKVWSSVMENMNILTDAIQLFLGNEYTIQEALDYENNDWRFTMQLEELKEYRQMYQKYVITN